jgi:hypothetical protein
MKKFLLHIFFFHFAVQNLGDIHMALDAQKKATQTLRSKQQED